MNKRFWLVFLVAVAILPIAIIGCKGKVEKPQEMPPAMIENQESGTPATTENVAVTEPAQTVATETIPPTAAPEIAKPAALPQQIGTNRSKDIQKALKNAGFYAGTVDGKIGPRTKKAIEEFQKAKGLKADGKVGPKTWTEMQKYLTQ
jgi:peptidoglycan hydrolase-like protein with peptidoglycan-binding domain